MNPAVLDKLDMDQAIDEFSTAIMAPPKLVVGDVEVAKKRQADAEAAARQQQMEQMSQMADAGSKVANIMPDEMKNQLGDSLADATGN